MLLPLQTLANRRFWLGFTVKVPWSDQLKCSIFQTRSVHWYKSHQRSPSWFSLRARARRLVTVFPNLIKYCNCLNCERVFSFSFTILSAMQLVQTKMRWSLYRKIHFGILGALWSIFGHFCLSDQGPPNLSLIFQLLTRARLRLVRLAGLVLFPGIPSRIKGLSHWKTTRFYGGKESRRMMNTNRISV